MPADVMPEPSKREIDARAYQLWEKAGRPEGREMNFGTWLKTSCAMRTNPRQHAPLTCCNATGRTYSDPSTCETIASTKITDLAHERSCGRSGSFQNLVLKGDAFGVVFL